MATPTAPARTGYHHGNLVEALIAAAIALIEERGVEGLSVREVAKRAGVSPGAPFRHFDSKVALLTAVAEQAIERLTSAVNSELSAIDKSDGIEGLRAIGRGYLSWAYKNPTHFHIVSSRSLIDFESSEKLVKENEDIRQLIIEFINNGQSAGQIKNDIKVDDLTFALRGLGYGIARMWVDGHFKEWKIDRPPEIAMLSVLDLFIEALRP